MIARSTEQFEDDFARMSQRVSRFAIDHAMVHDVLENDVTIHKVTTTYYANTHTHTHLSSAMFSWTNNCKITKEFKYDSIPVMCCIARISRGNNLT